MAKLRFVLYILYTGLLIYLVFSSAGNYGRQIHDFPFKERVNFIPFKDKMPYFRFDSYLKYNDWYYFIREVSGNFFLLFPVPFFLAFLEGITNYKKVIFICLTISFGIESMQLFLNYGQADIDDIILNTLGAAISMMLAGYIRTGNVRRNGERLKYL